MAFQRGACGLGIFLVLITHGAHGTFRSLCDDKPDGSMYPHFKHLSWYFRCASGIAELFICPPNYEAFDHGLSMCNRRKPPQTMVVTTKPSTTTCLPSTLATNPPAVIKPTWPAINTETIVRCSCHDTPTPTYHRDARHCDRYFLCYRGRPMPMSCCPGSHWSQAAGRCVPAQRSRCSANVTVPSLSGTGGEWGPTCPATGRALYPHPTVCEWFYYCENGVRTRQQCSAFTQWDCRQRRCVAMTQAQCIKSVPSSSRLQYYA